MKIDIINVKITDLTYNEKHPIKLRKSTKYFQLLDSITDNGILQPIRIRKQKKGYEVIDGRLRVEAHKDLELLEVPAIVDKVDEDTTITSMIDYNLYRDDILPSELGFMFRLRMEAMNRQGKKSNLTCGHAVHKTEDNKKTRDEVAELVGKSGRTVSRYIRLTYLIPQLLELVDSGKLPLVIGADLSYLEVEQEWVQRTIEKHGIYPSKEQARQIKEAYQKKKLTLASLDKILLIKELGKPQKLVFDYSDFIPFFDENTTPKQIKTEVLKVLCLATFPMCLKTLSPLSSP